MSWTRRFGTPIGPETSVLNHLTPRNNPEYWRIQFNRGESLRSSKYKIDKLYVKINYREYIFMYLYLYLWLSVTCYYSF